MDEKVYWYWLCHRDGLGAVKITRLLKGLGDPKRIYHASVPDLIRLGGLSENEAKKVKSGDGEIALAEKDYLQMQQRGIRMLVATEEDFPMRLRNIPNPPVCLFVKGAMPREDEVTTAVVGARACTEYGMMQAIGEGFNLLHHSEGVIQGSLHHSLVQSYKYRYKRIHHHLHH